MTKDWELLHTQGYSHQLVGEWAKALACYRQALGLKPDYARAQLAIAQLTMLQSGFREGRDQYEARFFARDETGGFDWRQLPIPRWRGESLAGKHLYLWAEQGFGDVIMYGGFLPHLLAEKPSRITFGMFPKMMSLFARSFPMIAVESLKDGMNYALSSSVLNVFPGLQKLAQETGLQIDLEPMRADYERAKNRGTFDVAAPMGDMLVYGLPEYVPAHHQTSFLSADSAQLAATKENLRALGNGKKIGISWHTTNAQSGYARNIPLAEWLPLLRVPNIHFISLQHHISAQEIARFNAENNCNIIADPSLDIVQNTEGLVALTACMDEIITIDNSTVHLAGALGVPTTLLLPKGCDFRWPQPDSGLDTLWYHSVKTERQETAFVWQPVIQRVCERLR